MKKIKDVIEDIKFNVEYDIHKMGEKNKENYGSDLPDCCTANRKENEKQAGKTR